MPSYTKSILIIDDNEAHRHLIKRALKQVALPYKYLEAPSLKQGWQLLFEAQETLLDLALTIIDLDLGDGRGTKLIAELRTSSLYQDIPILVLSTSTLERDIHESYQAGANCYLTKTEDLSTFTNDLKGAVKFLMERE